MYEYGVSIQMSGGSPRAKVVLYAGSVFKLFILVLHNFCYHSNVMSHFSSLLGLSTLFLYSFSYFNLHFFSSIVNVAMCLTYKLFLT